MYSGERRKPIFGKRLGKIRVMGLEKVFREISLRNNFMKVQVDLRQSILNSRTNRIGSGRVAATHITKRQLLLGYWSYN